MEEAHVAGNTTDPHIRVDFPCDILECVGIYNRVRVGAEDDLCVDVLCKDCGKYHAAEQDVLFGAVRLDDADGPGMVNIWA